MMKQYVEPERLAGSNLALKSLIKSNLSPILLGLIIAIAFNILAGIVAAFSGCFFSSGEMIGFIQQPTTIPAMLAGAAIFAFYIWMPRGIANALNGIAENKVIGAPIKDDSARTIEPMTLEMFSEKMTRSFSRWFWWVLPLVLSFLAAMVGVYPVYMRYYHAQTACTTSTLTGVVLSVTWMVLCMFATFGFVFYAFLAVFWFNKLFKCFKIRIQLLHPDGAGGLSPLGNLALKLSYPITVVGFVLVLVPMTRQYALDRTFTMLFTPDIITGIVLYLILSPIVFFAPLATAHNSMRQAKNGMLLKIANKFDQEYCKIEKEISKEKSAIEKPFKRMTSIQSLYRDIRKFPVWPFNTENITRFVSSTLSPILLAIVTNILTGLIP